MKIINLQYDISRYSFITIRYHIIFNIIAISALSANLTPLEIFNLLLLLKPLYLYQLLLKTFYIFILYIVCEL